MSAALTCKIDEQKELDYLNMMLHNVGIYL